MIFVFIWSIFLVGILFHNLCHPYMPLHLEEMIFPLENMLSPTLFAVQSSKQGAPHVMVHARVGGDFA